MSAWTLLDFIPLAVAWGWNALYMVFPLTMTHRGRTRKHFLL